MGKTKSISTAFHVNLLVFLKDRQQFLTSDPYHFNSTLYNFLQQLLKLTGNHLNDHIQGRHMTMTILCLHENKKWIGKQWHKTQRQIKSEDIFALLLWSSSKILWRPLLLSPSFYSITKSIFWNKHP